MIPASSILLILSAAAGAERFTRRPSSLWVSLALPCNSSRMRHPVLSNSLSYSAFIPENIFVSGYSFAKHILQAIPKTRFSVCTGGVPPGRSGRRGGSSWTRRRAVRANASPCLPWRRRASCGGELPFRQMGTRRDGPAHVALLRIALASAALLPYALLRGVWPGRRDLPLFLLVGLL